MSRRSPLGSVARLAFRGVLLATLAVATNRIRRARDRARDVPLSPLTAGWRVGAAYVERTAIEATPEPAGEMDDMGAYARPDFDTAAVHPEVRRFYERTAEYELTYRTRWHAGFRTGAALAALLTTRLEQLNLPGPGEAKPRRLGNRFVGIDPAADPRDGVRGWIRTDPETGAAVFVAAYASHERDGERYVNIAVPLPWSNLSTVLRIEALDAGAEGDGVRLTTKARAGDAGLYLVTPVGPFALPLDQTFRVWPAGAPTAPADFTDGEATVVARHEMWVYGRRFLTIDYACRPSDGFERGN